MKVICVSNHLTSDCSEIPGNITACFNSSNLPLIKDKEYVVYGMTIREELMWYYLMDENHLYYPTWYPSVIFTVSDNRLSSHWVYGYKYYESYQMHQTMISFREWVLDPYFYDKLTEGYEEEVSIFNHYRKILDEEF